MCVCVCVYSLVLFISPGARQTIHNYLIDSHPASSSLSSSYYYCNPKSAADAYMGSYHGHAQQQYPQYRSHHPHHHQNGSSYYNNHHSYPPIVRVQPHEQFTKTRVNTAHQPPPEIAALAAVRERERERQTDRHTYIRLHWIA